MHFFLYYKQNITRAYTILKWKGVSKMAYNKMNVTEMKLALKALFQDECEKIDGLVNKKNVYDFLKPRTELPLSTKQGIVPVLNELLIRRLEAKIS